MDTQLAPLTTQQERDVWKVVESYEAFWDHIKFRKGWAKQEVSGLLRTAAEVVVRIRTQLDVLHPEFKMRMVEGNSREFMWNVTKHPSQDPDSFLRGLIHATFQDGNGYVEGLTATTLDQQVDKILAYAPNQVADIRTQFTEVTELLNTTIFNEQWGKLGPSDGLELSQILSALKSIKTAVEAIEHHNTPTPQPVETDVGASPTSDELPEVEMESPPESLEQPPTPPEIDEHETAAQEAAQLEIKHVENDVGAIHSNILKLVDMANQFTTRDYLQDLPSAQVFLNKMNKQCLEYEEGLMQDLLHLDGIDNPTVRGERRKAVQNIQHLLDDVHEVKDKLRGLRESVTRRLDEALKRDEEKKKEEETKKRELERVKLEDAQRAGSKSPQEKRKSPEPERRDEELERATKQKMEEASTNMWKSLKFQPEFKVNEDRQKFTLRAYIPGMNLKDVKLSIKGNVLTVRKYQEEGQRKGYREPSPKELAVLKRQLWEQKRRPEFYNYFPRNEDENHHLLRLGAGRYGNFSVSFELPIEEVFTEDIQASYVGGVLQVIVPKRPQVQPTYAWGDDPNGGGYGRKPQRNQRSFFDDNDFFW